MIKNRADTPLSSSPFIEDSDAFTGYTFVYEHLMEDLTNQKCWLAVIVLLYGNAAFGLIFFSVCLLFMLMIVKSLLLF